MADKRWAAVLLYLLAAAGHGFWNFRVSAFQSGTVLACLSLGNFSWLALLIFQARRADGRGSQVPFGELLNCKITDANRAVRGAFLLLALVIVAVEFHNFLVLGHASQSGAFLVGGALGKVLVWALAFWLASRRPKLKAVGVAIVLAATFIAPVVGMFGCAVMACFSRRSRKTSAAAGGEALCVA